jgi:steroid delta-isomerase-like uncharacterized protein
MEGAAMSSEANKAIVARFYETALNTGDVTVLDQLATPDYEEHDPLPGQGTGREGLRDRVRMIVDAFGQRFTVEDMIAEGDRVVARWTGSGTHVGGFMGIPATGRSFTISGIDIYRMADGKMAEHWHVVDQLALLGQLGLLPQQESAEA